VTVPVRTVVRRGLAAAAAAGLLVLTSSTGALAADGTIVGIDRSGPGIQVTVDVPAGAEVDLDAVTATVRAGAADDVAYEATAARIADGATRVQRTTVLAIDTSGSMVGARFAAAKRAATTFLDTVPDDVAVGIVSFDSDVVTELEPSTDRAAAVDVIDGLSLSKGTLLFDGVIAAVDLTGTEGQRSVLVLSDGADGGTTSLDDVTTAIESAEGVVVDVVALEQSGTDLRALRAIAGDTGEVIPADRESLATTFSQEAEVLQRQVAVEIDVPDDVAAQQISVSVTLPSSAGDLAASSTVPATEPDETAGDPLVSVPQAPGTSTSAGTPEWLGYVGVGVFGAGLLAALVLLTPRKPVAMSAEDRVATYTASTRGGPDLVKAQPETALTQQASDAIAGVLDRNKGLNDRISSRLEGAGSELKPSEWLLVHGGAFLAISVVGLLLGRGNLVVGLLFMALGVVAPWIYLGVRGTRRRKAFEAALPETLQLMSGSLSAGLSLMQSVDTIVREGTEPVASAFRRVLVETRIGVSIEDALEGVADRFDSRDFRWVVMAIKIQRQVGGNLAELLNTVAATMREREYMRRQVSALAAEGKLSAVVLGGLPPIFLLYLCVSQYSYVEPLFTDVRGIIMLLGAGLWLGLGIFWMSKLVKVEV
jgi:tight adherence protein B